MKLFIKNHDLSKLLLIIALLTSYGLGTVSGVFYWRLQQIDHRPPPEIITDLVNNIPLIHLKKIENGILFGETSAEEMRFLIGNDLDKVNIYSVHDQIFELAITEILPMLKTLPSPLNTKFVASKRGKSFWPLDAPEAFMIPEANRVFYINEKEASKDGKKRGK